MVNYQNGKIYKIVRKGYDDALYIGSTCQTLCKRKAGHGTAIVDNSTRRQSRLNNLIRVEGIEALQIVLIESYPCNSKEELLAREQYYIGLFKPQCNQFRAKLTEEEKTNYGKINYEKHREKIIERSHNNYIKNKDEILDKMKEYRNKNKDSIREKKKIYREVNKDKIKQHKSEIHHCACGSYYTLCHESRHFKSSKHTKFMAKQAIKDDNQKEELNRIIII